MWNPRSYTVATRTPSPEREELHGAGFGHAAELQRLRKPRAVKVLPKTLEESGLDRLAFLVREHKRRVVVAQQPHRAEQLGKRSLPRLVANMQAV